MHNLLAGPGLHSPIASDMQMRKHIGRAGNNRKR
nr:MAG TPA: hypothetical protein [Bacteriophage sp.]